MPNVQSNAQSPLSAKLALCAQTTCLARLIGRHTPCVIQSLTTAHSVYHVYCKFAHGTNYGDLSVSFSDPGRDRGKINSIILGHKSSAIVVSAFTPLRLPSTPL